MPECLLRSHLGGNLLHTRADALDPMRGFSTIQGHEMLSGIMRMNLDARAMTSQSSDLAEDRICLTIRPACSLPGNYSWVTNRDALRRMLRRTELPSTVLEKFETGIYSPKGASLPAVELSEEILTQIGYFID